MADQLEIKAQNLDKLIDRFQRAPKIVPDVIEKNIRSLGMVIVGIERRVLKVMRYTGEMENSVSFEYEFSGTHFSMTIGPTSDHAMIVRTGTKPHWAPIGPLKTWAGWKLGDENAAYAVQRSIAYFGTSRYLIEEGIPGAEQTEFGIGYDFPGQTLERLAAQQGVQRQADRMGMDIKAVLENGEAAAGVGTTGESAE